MYIKHIFTRRTNPSNFLAPYFAFEFPVACILNYVVAYNTHGYITYSAQDFLYRLSMATPTVCREHSTLYQPKMFSMMNPDEIFKTQTGAALVNKILKRGILTKVLQEFLTARNEAKELKESRDLFIKSILIGGQLSLIISSNYVYAFTGAQVFSSWIARYELITYQ